jgi:hypothetical protein
LIPVGECANDDFQIDLFAQGQVGPTGRAEKHLKRPYNPHRLNACFEIS